MPTRFLAFLLCLAAEAAPRVTGVEPPSWWKGGAWKPVRLMLRGEGLAGARLDPGCGLKASGVSTNQRGTYLFADLDLSRARPGRCLLRMTAEGGAAEAPFTVLPPIDRSRGFQGFSSDDVIYLIMPDRFANGDPSNDDPEISRGLFDRSRRRHYHGGDFQGIIARLPYLRELGVTALWLNPWYDNANHSNEIERYDGEGITDYHGYGAVDFYGVEEHLGGFEALERLVEAAHGVGIKVIQDQVANHTGPYHPWVKEPPTPGWYHGTAERHLDNDWQYWTQMDPYSTPAVRRRALEGWFINILPDLNQDNRETRRYLIQNALWWAGVLALDGIRQDTLPYVPRDFWRDWRAALKAEFPTVNVVGEVLNEDPALVAFYEGGAKRFDGVDSGIESLFDFPLMFSLRESFAKGKPLRELARRLGRDGLYRDPQRLVTLLGCHDIKRFLSEPGAAPGGLKLAFTFLFTTRGIPLLYYGDEIGMEGGDDPDNRRDFPGGWREDPRNAFDAAGRTAPEREMFTHVQRLIALRKGSAALRRGSTRLLGVREQAMVYGRVSGGEAVVVALNNGAKKERLEFALEGWPDGEWSDALGGGTRLAVQQGAAVVELGPVSGALFSRTAGTAAVLSAKTGR